MNTNHPAPADARQQLRDAIFNWLFDLYGKHVDVRVDDAAALLAGPLADLAALPARLHQLADELDDEAGIVCASSPHACEAYGAAADRLRALTPDTRQEQP